MLAVGEATSREHPGPRMSMPYAATAKSPIHFRNESLASNTSATNEYVLNTRANECHLEEGVSIPFHGDSQRMMAGNEKISTFWQPMRNYDKNVSPGQLHRFFHVRVIGVEHTGNDDVSP